MVSNPCINDEDGFESGRLPSEPEELFTQWTLNGIVCMEEDEKVQSKLHSG